MVSIEGRKKGRKRTLGGQTVYKNGSIDTSLGPSLFSLDTTFKWEKADGTEGISAIAPSMHWGSSKPPSWLISASFFLSLLGRETLVYSTPQPIYA
jgi:hypothetical protein